MAKAIQFEEFDPRENSGQSRPPQCVLCEQMLADAVDETLTSEDQAWFNRHLAGCLSCSDRAADAKRGAAWLELLRTPRPEPSASLLSKILAQTCGLEGVTGGIPTIDSDVLPLVPVVLPLPLTMPLVALPARPQAAVLAFPMHLVRRKPLVQTIFEPRLMMTAAMAFFSIALTLNLTGVRLNQLHASDLKPANLQHTYFEANARAIRYYDNLRMVRVLESRVDDLRGNNELDRTEGTRARSSENVGRQSERSRQPENKSLPQQREHGKPKTGQGTSRLEVPGKRSLLQLAEYKSSGNNSFRPVVLPLSSKDGGLV